MSRRLISIITVATQLSCNTQLSLNYSNYLIHRKGPGRGGPISLIDFSNIRPSSIGFSKEDASIDFWTPHFSPSPIEFWWFRQRKTSKYRGQNRPSFFQKGPHRPIAFYSFQCHITCIRDVMLVISKTGSAKNLFLRHFRSDIVTSGQKSHKKN